MRPKGFPKTLLKNVVLWDAPPLRSTGVPNLFGLFPLRCQFADEKAPNKLGIPTGESFFNRIIETKRLVEGALVGGKRLVPIRFSTEFILSLSKGSEATQPALTLQPWGTARESVGPYQRGMPHPPSIRRVSPVTLSKAGEHIRTIIWAISGRVTSRPTGV